MTLCFSLKESCLYLLTARGDWEKGVANRLCSERFPELFPVLTFCERSRLGWHSAGMRREGGFLEETVGCALSTPPHSHTLSSLGSRPIVLWLGEREAWAHRWDSGPRESISARCTGGDISDRNSMTRRERQEPQSCLECGEFMGTGRKMGWRAGRSQTSENRTSLLLREHGESSAICSHPVFWPWTSTPCACVSRAIKKEGRIPSQSMLQIQKFLSLYLFIFSSATQEATANLQGAVVARGWIMAVLIWLCKSSEEPKARYRNIS